MNLRDALDTSDNGLNFVRLLLAVMVIVSHAWPLGGFGYQPHLGDLPLGSWAVAGFFAISGYLVTGSRMRLGLGSFVLRRALRIYPGFWACLIVVAFVFAPLAALGTGSPFDLSRAAQFVWSNATTVISQTDIGGELDSLPYSGAWDASLWTLQYELSCYVLTGLTLCWGWAHRDVTRTMVAVFVAITVFDVTCAQAGFPLGGPLLIPLKMAAYFAAGSLLWSLRDRIRVNRWWVAGACAALIVFAMFRIVNLVGALPLAYLALAFGAWCPIRWGVQRDLSYGVYVYAWPVQQMLVLVGVARLGVAVFIAAAAACVVPLAWLSWRLVERPALRLVKRRTSVAAQPDASLALTPAVCVDGT